MTEHKRRQRMIFETAAKHGGVTEGMYEFKDISELRKKYFQVKLLEKKTEIIKCLSSKTDTMLDVGSAEGINLQLAAGRFTHTLLVGLDISANALRKLKKRLPMAEAVEGDAENLPFRDQAFDLVISSELLEHLLEPRIALDETLRVARMYALITTCGRSFLRVLIDKLAPSLTEGNRSFHPSDIDFRDILLWVKKKGGNISECYLDCYIPNEIISALKLPINIIEKIDKLLRRVPIIKVRFPILQIFLLSKENRPKYGYTSNMMPIKL